MNRLSRRTLANLTAQQPYNVASKAKHKQTWVGVAAVVAVAMTQMPWSPGAALSQHL